MAWIESHTVLIRHRKLLQLAVALSLRPVEVLGHLTALWHTVLEQQEDGNLTDWPDEMIAQAAQYKGDPKLFVAELHAKKWLDGKIVHDWVDYAGRYLESKYRRSNPKKLNAILRIHKARLKTGYSQALPRLKPAYLPDLTLPNQDKIKEPKIIKHTYGDFQKVRLTISEYEKLVEQFGKIGTEERIKDLELYIGSKGDKYKSHYLTILNWEKKNTKDEKEPTGMDALNQLRKEEGREN